MSRLWMVLLWIACIAPWSIAQKTQSGAIGTGPSDVVLDWNQVLLDATRRDPVESTPTHGTRNMAMVHIAIYDAINAIVPQRQPYALKDYHAPAGASLQAAASQAAWRVLIYLYPDQRAQFDQELERQLAMVKNEAAKQMGIKVGDAAGQAIILLRANDGWDRKEDYQLRKSIGNWQPTPPDYTFPPLGSEWGKLTPFSLDSSYQYRPDPPPPLKSAAYAQAFNQVKLLGKADNRFRTREQTLIGIFWSYDQFGLRPPQILYNQILRRIAMDKHNSVLENAYLFAIVNMGFADAIVGCWEGKYYYNHWRPVTAIRKAQSDGNPLTEEDRDWLPLGGGAPETVPIPNFTPPFPAYASGHSSMGETMFHLLRKHYGTDLIKFTIGSDELPGYTRSFSSFSQASWENGISRVYLGVHWIYDVTAAIKMGHQVGEWVYCHELLPLPKK